MSRPVRSCRSSSALDESRDVLVGAVERRAEDRDDADRVLVAEGDGLLDAQREAIALHRHELRLDLEEVAELVPADLGVDPEDQVRLVGRLAGVPAPLLPAALERQRPEHARLARARRRAADTRLRRVPQVAEHRHAAPLELGRLRVLVLVDHVLVEALGHQRVGLRLHPRRHERREVQPRVAVEQQLGADHAARRHQDRPGPEGTSPSERAGRARAGTRRARSP